MNEWKTVRLGDVCEKGSSNIAQNEIADNNGEYPIYGAAGFIKNVDFYKQDKPYIGIVKDGAGVGRVSVHPAKSSLIGTMQYIFPKENIDIKFLAEFLKYQNLSRFYTGATIPHIYFKDYQNIPLKLPSLQKQKHISAVLDKCAELTVKNKRILEKYDTLIKSRFIEMFGDNPIENGKWKVEKLEDVCDLITDGTHKTPNYQQKGIRFISAKNIINGKIDLTDTKFITEEEYKQIQKRCRVEKNDVLLTKSGSLGSSAIIDFDIPIGLFESLAVIKYKRNLLNGIFVKELLSAESSQKQFNNGVKGIAIKHLHLNVIAALKIPIPPLELQNDFAAFVQQIDKSKFAVQKSLEKTETLYKSLMQRYFA